MPNRKTELVAWCFYDWANSAFPTVVITFVFASYFTTVVAPDEVFGMAAWGWMISLSGVLVALISPLLSSAANNSGKKKSWLLALTLITSLMCIFLWNVKGNEHYLLICLILIGTANLVFELAMIFYNALLGVMTPRNQIGQWSGLGWAAGYFGGLSCLVFTLLCFVMPENPLFNLEKDSFEHLRICGPIVGLWFLTFSLPFFLLVNEKSNKTPSKLSFKGWFKQLLKSLKGICVHKNLLKFLIARMIYTDGLTTLFAMGGIYAAGSFGFNFQDIIVFGIIINVTAGIGALIFAWVDDIIGSKKTIYICLYALIILSSVILFIKSKEIFWIIGSALGLFVGPVQASSRSLMIKIAPKKTLTQMFGFYALSGKVTAFLGPAILATVAKIFESQRMGMATIIIFFLTGLFLLKYVESHE